MIDTSNTGNANYPVAPTPFDNPIGQPQMKPQDNPYGQYSPQGHPMDPNQGHFQPEPQYNPNGESVMTENSMANPFIPGDQPELGGLSSKLAQNARIGFIRKVYGIFSAQLLLTTAIVVTAINIDGIEKILASPQMITLFIISIVLNLVSCFTLCCFRKVARSVPANYILLAIFTLTESFML